jgi:hypothetical protein
MLKTIRYATLAANLIAARGWLALRRAAEAEAEAVAEVMAVVLRVQAPAEHPRRQPPAEAAIRDNGQPIRQRVVPPDPG